jgi:hypothetical protein
MRGSHVVVEFATRLPPMRFQHVARAGARSLCASDPQELASELAACVQILPEVCTPGLIMRGGVLAPGHVKEPPN